MESLHELEIFVYQQSITRDFLDELDHANYNELKKIFEIVRYRLFGYLGFRRNKIRKKLSTGFVMTRDSYEYLKALKEGDNIFFRPTITLVNAIKVTVELHVFRWGGADRSTIEPTNHVTYEMVMVNLKTGRPARIPKPILRSIERFRMAQIALMHPTPRPPDLPPSRLP